MALGLVSFSMLAIFAMLAHGHKTSRESRLESVAALLSGKAISALRSADNWETPRFPEYTGARTLTQIAQGSPVSVTNYYDSDLERLPESGDPSLRTFAMVSTLAPLDPSLLVSPDAGVTASLARLPAAANTVALNLEVSSTPRLKTNYVSDQRLVTYYLSSNAIWRAVVEPTASNYPVPWNPLLPEWWTNNVTNEAEALLEGVYPYDSGYPDPFVYTLRDGSLVSSTTATNPPSGLTIGFAIAGRRARARESTPTNQLKKIKYDIELNVPPAFNP